MNITLKLIIATVAVIAILIGGFFYANFYIKKTVAQKLTEEFGLEFTNLETSLWKRSISVDSVQGFLNDGSIASAKLDELNWISLFFDPEIDLDDVCFTATGFHTNLSDGLYTISIDSLSKERGNFYARSVQLGTPYADQEFHRKVKFRTPRIVIDVPHIYGSGFQSEGNTFDEIIAKDFKVDVDENLNVPADGNKKKLPGQLLKDLGVEFNIKRFEIENGSIHYAVINKGRSQKGNIDFSNVQFKAENIRTDSLAEEMILDLNCTMEGAPLKVVMRNFLQHPEYKYDFYGQLQNLDFVKLNDLTNAARGISIESGHVNKMEMEGSFFDNHANGTVSLDYSDLKVDMPKGQIVDFISNVAIKNDGSEKVEFDTQRDHDRGFLVHVIQSIIQSLKDILLII
ncbi:hypothetical protein [Portibacter marinus]|uniref:hypothetical protein n=1 Tax=Portibacter marinus TaxID=2898660 RepID=UPI001F243897|nr:hypothetical protein [Portibacter marinus]